MIIFNQRADALAMTAATVTLSFQQRQRSNLRVTLADGQDAGIQLPRTESLKPGDRLLSTCGLVVEVIAEPEQVSTAIITDPLVFGRACYHLGNRHVKLQIEPQRVSYLHDHVLDGLLDYLGVEVTVEYRAFEPESGAYHGGHSHSHDHDHH